MGFTGGHSRPGMYNEWNSSGSVCVCHGEEEVSCSQLV